MHLTQKLNYFTFVVMGVVVVVEMLVVEVLVVDATVVVETTTSASVVGTSELRSEVVALDIGTATRVVGATTLDIGSASSGVTTSVTAGGGAATVVSGGDFRRVCLLLLRASVGRLEAALVAFTANRLETAVQRCPPPQHRMIQLRAFFAPAPKLY
jgi:hypothetical protein